MLRSINTSIRRRGGAALIVTTAFLALAPAALASAPVPPDRADGLGGANPTSHIASVVPPDRADHLGGAIQGPSVVTLSPDRQDGLGSARFVQPQPATVILRSTSTGFDWTSALIGAVAGLGISLAAMAALMMRGRRGVALPS
jgi:hypothetical protein